MKVAHYHNNSSVVCANVVFYQGSMKKSNVLKVKSQCAADPAL